MSVDTCTGCQTSTDNTAPFASLCPLKRALSTRAEGQKKCRACERKRILVIVSASLAWDAASDARLTAPPICSAPHMECPVIGTQATNLSAHRHKQGTRSVQPSKREPCPAVWDLAHISTALWNPHVTVAGPCLQNFQAHTANKLRGSAPASSTTPALRGRQPRRASYPSAAGWRVGMRARAGASAARRLLCRMHQAPTRDRRRAWQQRAAERPAPDRRPWRSGTGPPGRLRRPGGAPAPAEA